MKLIFYLFNMSKQSSTYNNLNKGQKNYIDKEKSESFKINIFESQNNLSNFNTKDNNKEKILCEKTLNVDPCTSKFVFNNVPSKSLINNNNNISEFEYQRDEYVIESPNLYEPLKAPQNFDTVVRASTIVPKNKITDKTKQHYIISIILFLCFIGIILCFYHFIFTKNILYLVILICCFIGASVMMIIQDFNNILE